MSVLIFKFKCNYFDLCISFRPRVKPQTEESQELPEVTRAPFVPSRVRNQESQEVTQSPDKSSEATTTRARNPVRNRNIFNTANRRVPLNRFRGRQRVVKPVEPEEVEIEIEEEPEKIEIKLEIQEEERKAEPEPEQVSSTESALRRPLLRRNQSLLDRLKAQRESRPKPNIR